MRRFNQELSEEESIEILINQPRGVLAVLGDNDYPYAIPMDHVYYDGKLYFHSAKEGHKIDAINKHSKVSYCVINDGIKEGDNWWYIFKSVIIFGNIRILEDGEDKLHKLTVLGNKFFPTEEYTQEEIENSADRVNVFEITIEHMTGKVIKEK